MTTLTRDELALYVMGEHDDPASLEAALAGDGADAVAARVVVAEEARFEALLREAGAAARFCPACGDLVDGARCDACGAALEPGGYVVERVLVQNGHGRMYVARDADGRQVALKELAFVQSPTLASIAAFEREARFLRALDHPAIPRFVASFEEGQGVHVRYYLAQELVSGPSLASLLEHHWFSEGEIRDLARQVLTVLVYLQGLSPRVIHRDIKPANLLRRADGTIAVVDFGAAYVQGATAGATTIGTFGYMPIEQLAGEVDATTDPYALGASLLHLLGRQEPWRLVQGRGLDGINVSAPLRGFLARLIAPEPAARFPDAAAALAALDALDAPTTIAAPAVATEAPRSRPRRGVLVYAAAAAALLAAGGGAFSIARHELRARRHAAAPVVAADAAPGQPVPQPIPAPPPAAALPAGEPVDLDVRDVPLADVLRLLADACAVNIVIPDDVQAAVTVRLQRVRCDQAIEAVLAAKGLGYEYRPDTRIVRVTTRAALEERAARDQERAAADQARAAAEQARATVEQARAAAAQARAAAERREDGGPDGGVPSTR